jgi:hypothetical protein
VIFFISQKHRLRLLLLLEINALFTLTLLAHWLVIILNLAR